jgi:hypothetical protein
LDDGLLHVTHQRGRTAVFAKLRMRVSVPFEYSLHHVLTSPFPFM